MRALWLALLVLVAVPSCKKRAQSGPTQWEGIENPGRAVCRWDFADGQYTGSGTCIADGRAHMCIRDLYQNAISCAVVTAAPAAPCPTAEKP